jgi:hypothetical protein
MTRRTIITPAHFDVAVDLDDTTTRLYRVVAVDDDAASAHVFDLLLTAGEADRVLRIRVLASHAERRLRLEVSP